MAAAWQNFLRLLLPLTDIDSFHKIMYIEERKKAH
jgi:hypothetical protein